MTMIIPKEVGVQRLTAVYLRGHLRLVAAGMESRVSKTYLLKKPVKSLARNISAVSMDWPLRTSPIGLIRSMRNET